jgi:plastocyanin
MKKFAALIALLLAALALVACGGGSDTTSEESAPAPETTKEAEGEKEAEGGTAGAASVEFEADPSGNLAFTTSEVTSKAGKVTVNFTNQSAVPHDVALEDEAGETIAQTETVAEGTDSTTAELKPGKYTFYCTVPGHRQAGMEGTLTVK